MIKYFNKISIELFQKLSDLKYTIDYIEINEKEKYIGINLFTENFNVYNLSRKTPMPLGSWDVRHIL